MLRNQFKNRGTSRRGVSPKGCLFAIIAVVALIALVVAAIAWFAHSKLARETARPIALVPVPDEPKVMTDLETKCREATKAVSAGKEGSITLSSDELHLLVRQGLPDNIRDSVRITLKDDAVQIQAPIKGSIAAEYIPKEYSSVKWYVAKLAYLNVEADGTITFDRGLARFTVKKVSRPLEISAAQIQTLVDEGLKAQKASAQVPLGGETVTLTSCEIKDSTAVLRFTK